MCSSCIQIEKKLKLVYFHIVVLCSIITLSSKTKLLQLNTVQSDGKRKKYHWCEYHKLWTIHSPKECKKQPTGKNKGRKALYKKSIKYGEKKKAYMIAKAALATLPEDDSASDQESNTSVSDNDSNASSIDGGKYSDEEGSDTSVESTL
jgi:hypothetical protein